MIDGGHFEHFELESAHFCKSQHCIAIPGQVRDKLQSPWSLVMGYRYVLAHK